MCWDEHHDDDVDALTKKLVFWNPDRGDKQNVTGYDNKRLDGRNKKKTGQLHCCTYTWYTQQYQYVPKETVRHQASCEEIRRASQVSRVLLYSINSNGVFVGRVSRAYVQHFMMPGTCYVPDAYDTRYQVRTNCIAICLFERGWWYARERGRWYAWHLRSDWQPAVSLVGGGTHDTYVPPKKQLYRRGYPMKSHSAADARQNQLQKRVLQALFHLRCPSQSHQRSARGRTRLTTVTSISCRSL